MATILFDGVAYGMLLFVLACGLAVTLGLMNFVNLAHGAFAMAGGYVTVVLMDRAGVPFLLTLPAAFAIAAVIGLVLERTLYLHMYGRSHLDQVLFSIGLVFMAVAATDYFMGSSQRNITLPDWLQGRREVLGVSIGVYRSFIIVLCGALAIALQFGLMRTRFGARLRAAVDDTRVARGLGIPVNLVFAVTFAVGSGLAGLGGALGVGILGLDPYFPLKFMIYFLIVVTVGGTSRIIGPFGAALLLGVADVAGKYYLSSALGGFVIYVVMIVVLVVRPNGLFASAMSAADSLKRRARWRWPEIVFWLVAFAALFVPSGKHLILNEVAIFALFALSLDLILGYAGIVSLGHAAFFGLGAYTAGLMCKHVMPDPLAGLAAATVVAAIVGLLTSFLVLRGADLTRLMVTLGVSLVLHELANSLSSITGGADGLQGMTVGPLLGAFEFDLYGRTAYGYSLTVLFVLFVLARVVVHSPFGLSLMAIRRNPLRASAIGVPVHGRLIAVYTLAAAYAGAAGALLAQTTAYVSLEVLEFNRSADVLLALIIGGPGWLYGGIAGALVFKILQDVLSSSAPQFWMFWMGLFLVVLALVGRERLTRLVLRR